jgi:hypothetical protein
MKQPDPLTFAELRLATLLRTRNTPQQKLGEALATVAIYADAVADTISGGKPPDLVQTLPTMVIMIDRIAAHEGIDLAAAIRIAIDHENFR